MQNTQHSDMTEFLPYLLNQAADRLSLEFRQIYKGRYGMLRTEWRVLFHLGCYGEMTATRVCNMARLHKTKVSRAVSALQAKRFLERKEQAHDRRHALLSLTREGQRVFRDLDRQAKEFDARIRAEMSEEEAAVLQKVVTRLANLPPQPDSASDPVKRPDVRPDRHAES